ncbi:hypothetical protein [Flavobacterium oreochromis]|uniref:hypothetical protein n=1 Tax=Flavobacterium oreochromis TaxID=2906078 RepID=UPI002869E37E|nr:hypothetical protein [Flavobacterium oreochromis]
MKKIIGEFILQWFNPDSDLQVQTSGTTGVAKQIALKKQAMVYSAQSTGGFF